MIPIEEVYNVRNKIHDMYDILDTVEDVIKKTGRTDIWHYDKHDTHIYEAFRDDLRIFLGKLIAVSSRTIPDVCLSLFALELDYDEPTEEDIYNYIQNSPEITYENMYEPPLTLLVAIQTEIFFRESHLCDNDNLPRRIYRIFGDLGHIFLEDYEADEQQLEFYSEYMKHAFVEPLIQAGLFYD